MLVFLKYLNPIYYSKNERIYSELDDVSIVTFVMEGTYKIGFEVNKKEYFYL